jgi:REP element-mobilizing transposase RayT
MPRTARLNRPGGVFHLVSRFAREERWLDRTGARETYLELLGTAAEKGQVDVLAYCLMSNHTHLVVVQGDLPLERFTKSLNTGFASWAHQSKTRGKAQGAVFAERPRSLLVDADAYLLQLVRYVHNNPVRAGVVRYARSSTWSSHPAYIGRAGVPEWLRLGYVLDRFGRDHGTAAERFDAFVNEGRGEERRPELSGAADAGEAAEARKALGDGHRISDGVLGRDAFVKRVTADTRRVRATLASRGSERRAGAVARPPVRDVIDAVLTVQGTDVLELEQRPKSKRSSAAKRLAIWLWVHEYDGAQIDMARALDLDTSVVSRHYGEALAAAGDYDEQATAVTAALTKRARPKGKKGANVLPIRYHVDVDET